MDKSHISGYSINAEAIQQLLGRFQTTPPHFWANASESMAPDPAPGPRGHAKPLFQRAPERTQSHRPCKQMIPLDDPGPLRLGGATVDGLDFGEAGDREMPENQS